MRTGETSVPNADSTLALTGNTTPGLEQFGHPAGVNPPAPPNPIQRDTASENPPVPTWNAPAVTGRLDEFVSPVTKVLPALSRAKP